MAQKDGGGLTKQMFEKGLTTPKLGLNTPQVDETFGGGIFLQRMIL
jgi:hypothetical protein